jgi:hypothetical protein
MFSFQHTTKKILKDDTLQQKLNSEGYVIVPFYTPEDIQRLTDYYYEITPTRQKGFQPTTYFQDNEYRDKASSEILRVAKPHLERILQDYKTFMGSFIVKHSDTNSELGVHQDMTLVDESQYMGVNIWAPLCDTTDKNGALHLIPKSHRLFPTYRAATIPNIYDRYNQEIKRYMQPVYMKAGEAILFDNSLIHFSPVNRSGETRIATNVFITHKNATITICYNDREKNKIELFEQGDDFFTTYEQFDNDQNMLRPKIGKSIGFTDYDFPVLTPQKMRATYGEVPGQGFLKRVLSLLKN